MNGKTIYAQYEQAQRLFTGEGTEQDIAEYQAIVDGMKLTEYGREMAQRAIDEFQIKDV